MIGRLWRGWAADAENADAYQRVFTGEVMAELDGLPGFRGAYLLRGEHEFLALTLFDDMADVRAFAGDDPERANVSAPARAVLAGFDDRARHYTVVSAPMR